jgi:hypothetical protein
MGEEAGRQVGELAKVKARIKALAEKTVSNGCTEAEAMAAAEMVGRLLERYALSMAEIDVREERCVQTEITLGGRQRRPIDGCVPAIARFCDCKVWLSRSANGIGYTFFGFEPDTAMARYLLQVIDHAMRAEAAIFKRGLTRTKGGSLRKAGNSFEHGMANRIAERLEAMHAAREAGVAAQRSTGTALILVKHRVVDQAFRETGIRLVSASGLRRRINAAYRQGMEAGGRVNLERPVRDRGRGLIR